MSHSWYAGNDSRHPFDGVTDPLDPVAAGAEKYSWSKAPRYDNMVVEAGSLAREVIAGRPGAQPWQEYDPLFKSMFDELGPSIMLRVWSRMHEACKYYKQTVEMLDAVDLREPFYIKPKEIDGEGFGATEAIRGALAHWIRIKGGKIENYQIVAPTTINVGPRDAGGNIGPIEASLSARRSPIRPTRSRSAIARARSTPAWSAPSTFMTPGPPRSWPVSKCPRASVKYSHDRNLSGGGANEYRIPKPSASTT